MPPGCSHVNFNLRHGSLGRDLEKSLDIIDYYSLRSSIRIQVPDKGLESVTDRERGFVKTKLCD